MSTEPDERRYMLRLYVAGHTDAGRQAASDVQRICDETLGRNEYRLDVIDVRQHPGLADEDKVLATPTLILKAPPPQRRLIGDFKDTNAVSAGLGITYGPARGAEGAGR